MALQAQKLATDPRSNCWVSASAGTGKTKILIDRLARLLLLGFAPESILCITFTKAAANEMQERLLKKLQNWAIADEKFLFKELTDLLETQPSLTVLQRARTLFFIALDTPGGLRIQTIHSFCQSLLQNFPLEAEIDPCFELIEEDKANNLLKEAFQKTFENFSPSLQTDLDCVIEELSDTQFEDILQTLQNQRGKFYFFLHSYENLQQYKNHLEKLFLKELAPCPEESLRDIAEALMSHGTPAEKKWAEEILLALNDMKQLSKTLLTKEGAVPKKLASKKFEESFPLLYQGLQKWTAYCYQADQYAKNQKVIHLTVGFCKISKIIFDHYQALKTYQGCLDFEDLIYTTKQLLENPGISDWVLYKLNGGFNHILLDEAQDTSPAQWQIVQTLVEALLTPDAPERTLFVVGDLKQSIYSFQGAKPSLFLDLQKHFHDYLTSQGSQWRNIELHVSFRTTPAVLEVVDRLFKAHPYGVKFNEEIKHLSYRPQQPGLVEIWPLVEPDEKVDYEPWTPPIVQQPFQSTGRKLAQQIAEKVENLLKSRLFLSSTQKTIQPKDILILVKRRAEWVPSLLQQLKQRNIPVAGIDRLRLKNHIAVLDLLALGRFFCLPLDDYSLACVLKSPLINKGYGLNEEQLFDLCYEREGSLWQSLLDKKHQNVIYQEIVEFLKKWLSKVEYEDPFSLFHEILRETESQFIARLGEECQEILDEFLQQALIYRQTHFTGLQEFLDFINQRETDIKRSVSSQANQVRLMTVHGSKGLQAPIIIIADEGDQPSIKNELFLWDYNQSPLFLLKLSKTNDSEELAAIKARSLDKITQEQRRLLYVALTRSQEQLYIAGLVKQSKSGEWYNLLKEVLQEIGNPTPDGGYQYQPIPFQAQEILYQHKEVIELPSFFHESPPIERWKIQSKKESQLIPSTSVQQRGILIHRLFEILGNSYSLKDQDGYKLAAQRWCTKNDLENMITVSDIEKIVSILTDTNYQHFFGPSSVAEVEVQNKDFIGRIDRLSIIDDKVYILDYKTGMPPQEESYKVHPAYSMQLKNYKEALKIIYPNYSLHTFLLWTEGPYLVEVFK